MSDAYELLETSALVIGDTWTMLNNLGTGGGVSQVVSDLEGTVLLSEELSGIVIEEDYTGYLVEEDYTGTISIDELTAAVGSEDLEGTI